MTHKIKNIDSDTHTWGGQEIASGVTYTCLSVAESQMFAKDSVFITDFSAGDKAEVYDDDTKITDIALALDFLRGEVVHLDEQKDEEGRLYTREVITRPSYHYSPRSLDFYTSRHNSLYNRSHYCGTNDDDATIDGSPDLGDAFIKFYNASNVQLEQGAEESDEDFQTRLTANCVKTVVDLEPQFDYDILGAKLQILDKPTTRAYFWVVAAPDVPAAYGGNVVFMGGGMNLMFFGEGETFYCDGRTVSHIPYDGTYHSGKVAMIIKHAVGVQIGLQMIYRFYSEH